MKTKDKIERIFIRMRYLGETIPYYVQGKSYRLGFPKDNDIIFPAAIRSPRNRISKQQTILKYQTEEDFNKQWQPAIKNTKCSQA